MQLILFSKLFKEKSLEELVELAHHLGVEGYDLALRPGYPVAPDNAATTLPAARRLMERNGLSIPMVTGPTDLLRPDAAAVDPLLGAMDAADVRLLKLGYFKIDPVNQDYWEEVERARGVLEQWAGLGEKHQVKICYHTHSNRCLGLNAGMLAHLLRGLDPRYIGAYLDPAHLLAEGEEFALAAAIVREYLSIVSLKDRLARRRAREDHGCAEWPVVEAGLGMVDWTAVFSELKRLGFAGPLSIHCEFRAEGDFAAAVEREVAFFRRQREGL